MTLVDIARQYDVTPKAVEKALKKFDFEAYQKERERRKQENKLLRQQQKLQWKRTEIAKRKAKERMRYLRYIRSKYVKTILSVLKDREIIILLKHVADYFGDKEKKTLALYIPDTLVKHPVPCQAKKDVEYMTPIEATNRAVFESKMIKESLAGVPGKEVLEIRQALDLGDIRQAYSLAEAAVKNAGWVNPDATVGDVINNNIIFSPREVEKVEQGLVTAACSMAKGVNPLQLAELNKDEKAIVVKRWLRQALAFERAAGLKNSGGGVVTYNIKNSKERGKALQL